MSALAPDPNAQYATTPAQTIVPPNQQLGRNPMLPQHPLGAYTDSQYEAQNATLMQGIQKRYADLLQQLGYTDDQGNFIPGSAETAAYREQAGLERNMGLAREGVTREHQQLGTLFSGRRGEDQARAEFPYANREAEIAADLPVQLQKLYEQAAGLSGEYSIGQQQLLADAASRQAAAITKNPAGGVTGDGTAGGGMGGWTGPVSGLDENGMPFQHASDVPTDIYGGISQIPAGQPGGPLDLSPEWIAGNQAPGGVVNPGATPQTHPVVDIHKASMTALQRLQAGRTQRAGGF